MEQHQVKVQQAGVRRRKEGEVGWTVEEVRSGLEGGGGEKGVEEDGDGDGEEEEGKGIRRGEDRRVEERDMGTMG